MGTVRHPAPVFYSGTGQPPGQPSQPFYPPQPGMMGYLPPAAYHSNNPSSQHVYPPMAASPTLMPVNAAGYHAPSRTPPAVYYGAPIPEYQYMADRGPYSYNPQHADPRVVPPGGSHSAGAQYQFQQQASTPPPPKPVMFMSSPNRETGLQKYSLPAEFQQKVLAAARQHQSSSTTALEPPSTTEQYTGCGLYESRLNEATSSASAFSQQDGNQDTFREVSVNDNPYMGQESRQELFRQKASRYGISIENPNKSQYQPAPLDSASSGSERTRAEKLILDVNGKVAKVSTVSQSVEPAVKTEECHESVPQFKPADVHGGEQEAVVCCKSDVTELICSSTRRSSTPDRDSGSWYSDSIDIIEDNEFITYEVVSSPFEDSSDEDSYSQDSLVVDACTESAVGQENGKISSEISHREDSPCGNEIVSDSINSDRVAMPANKESSVPLTNQTPSSVVIKEGPPDISAGEKQPSDNEVVLEKTQLSSKGVLEERPSDGMTEEERLESFADTLVKDVLYQAVLTCRDSAGFSSNGDTGDFHDQAFSDGVEERGSGRLYSWPYAQTVAPDGGDNMPETQKLTLDTEDTLNMQSTVTDDTPSPISDNRDIQNQPTAQNLTTHTTGTEHEVLEKQQNQTTDTNGRDTLNLASGTDDKGHCDNDQALQLQNEELLPTQNCGYEENGWGKGVGKSEHVENKIDDWMETEVGVPDTPLNVDPKVTFQEKARRHGIEIKSPGSAVSGQQKPRADSASDTQQWDSSSVISELNNTGADSLSETSSVGHSSRNTGFEEQWPGSCLSETDLPENEFKQRASFHGIHIEHPDNGGGSGNVELELYHATGPSKDADLSEESRPGTPKAELRSTLKSLDPNSPVFQPGWKKEMSNTEMRVDAPAFQPFKTHSEMHVGVPVLRPTLGVSVSDEQLKKSMRVSATEFVPHMPKVKPVEKKKGGVFYLPSPKPPKPVNPDVGIQVEVDVTNRAVNTRRVTTKDVALLTWSCDTRDVCVNTMETEGDDSKILFPKAKKSQVSKATNTSSMRKRTVAIQCMTTGSGCALQDTGVMTEDMPYPTSPAPYPQSPGSGDTNIDLQQKVKQLQVELVQCKAQLQLDHLQKLQNTLKRQSDTWLEIFKDKSDRLMVSSLVRKKLTAINTASLQVRNVLQHTISRINAGVVFDKLPQFTCLSESPGLQGLTDSIATDSFGTVLQNIDSKLQRIDHQLLQMDRQLPPHSSTSAHVNVPYSSDSSLWTEAIRRVYTRDHPNLSQGFGVDSASGSGQPESGTESQNTNQNNSNSKDLTAIPTSADQTKVERRKLPGMMDLESIDDWDEPVVAPIESQGAEQGPMGTDEGDELAAQVESESKGTEKALESIDDWCEPVVAPIQSQGTGQGPMSPDEELVAALVESKGTEQALENIDDWCEPVVAPVESQGTEQGPTSPDEELVAALVESKRTEKALESIDDWCEPVVAPVESQGKEEAASGQSGVGQSKEEEQEAGLEPAVSDDSTEAQEEEELGTNTERAVPESWEEAEGGLDTLTQTAALCSTEPVGLNEDSEWETCPGQASVNTGDVGALDSVGMETQAEDSKEAVKAPAAGEENSANLQMTEVPVSPELEANAVNMPSDVGKAVADDVKTDTGALNMAVDIVNTVDYEIEKGDILPTAVNVNAACVVDDSASAVTETDSGVANSENIGSVFAGTVDSNTNGAVNNTIGALNNTVGAVDNTISAVSNSMGAMANNVGDLVPKGDMGLQMPQMSAMMMGVDPVLYQVVMAQLLQAYPDLATNPQMLSSVAVQQTSLLQYYLATGQQMPSGAAAITGPYGNMNNSSVPVDMLKLAAGEESAIQSQMPMSGMEYPRAIDDSTVVTETVTTEQVHQIPSIQQPSSSVVTDEVPLPTSPQKAKPNSIPDTKTSPRKIDKKNLAKLLDEYLADDRSERRVAEEEMKESVLPEFPSLHSQPTGSDNIEETQDSQPDIFMSPPQYPDCAGSSPHPPGIAPFLAEDPFRVESVPVSDSATKSCALPSVSARFKRSKSETDSHVEECDLSSLRSSAPPAADRSSTRTVDTNPVIEKSAWLEKPSASQVRSNPQSHIHVHAPMSLANQEPQYWKHPPPPMRSRSLSSSTPSPPPFPPPPQQTVPNVVGKQQDFLPDFVKRQASQGFRQQQQGNQSQRNHQQYPPNLPPRLQKLQARAMPESQENWENDIDDYAQPFMFKPDNKRPLTGLNIPEPTTWTGEVASISDIPLPKTAADTKEKKMDQNDEDEDEWCQVTKKKKKELKRYTAPSPPPSKTVKMSNFEKLVKKLGEKFPQCGRQAIVDTISEIRINRGGLSGMTMEEIIEKARDILHKPKIPGLWTNAVPPPRMADKRHSFPEVKCQTEEEICVICHDALTDEQTKSLDCGHVFHARCISKWIYGRERTCPTCRSHALFPEEFPRLGK